MALAIIIALIAASSFALYLLTTQSRAQKFIRSFPGPRMLPFIGNSWYLASYEDPQFYFGRLTNFSKAQLEYGNRVSAAGGSLKMLILFHPDDVGRILSSKDVLNKTRVNEVAFNKWFGSSLYYAKGKQHMKLRKMTSPAFDAKLLEKSSSIFNEQSKLLVKILSSNQAKGKATEIYWLLKSCTLDIIFEYLGGKPLHCLSRPDHEYSMAMHSLQGEKQSITLLPTFRQTDYVFRRCMSPWLWPEAVWKFSPLGRKEKTSRTILHEFMSKLTQDRKEEIVSARELTSSAENANPISKKEKLRLLDLLISEQERGEHQISDKYIRDEGNAFIFAGHDTVASSLTWTIFLLASHPEEQAKVHLEIDGVFHNDRGNDLNVNSCDWQSLKYLECCIKEAMRLYPPAPLFARTTHTDFQLDEKTTIPKGVDVMLCPWVTHRLPEFFPDPHEFRPSRFLHEDKNGRHPYAYFPFSSGQRSCMGQRLALAKEKTILVHIFRHFIVELESPPETVVPVANVVTFPKNGLNIRLKLR